MVNIDSCFKDGVSNWTDDGLSRAVTPVCGRGPVQQVRDRQTDPVLCPLMIFRLVPLWFSDVERSEETAEEGSVIDSTT